MGIVRNMWKVGGGKGMEFVGYSEEFMFYFKGYGELLVVFLFLKVRVCV